MPYFIPSYAHKIDVGITKQAPGRPNSIHNAFTRAQSYHEPSFRLVQNRRSLIGIKTGTPRGSNPIHNPIAPLITDLQPSIDKRLLGSSTQIERKTPEGSNPIHSTPNVPLLNNKLLGSFEPERRVPGGPDPIHNSVVLSTGHIEELLKISMEEDY